MGQRHKHAGVIIAWAEGKDVQVWSSVYGRWEDIKSDSPNFFADFEYRIKPPAKKCRVGLFNYPGSQAPASVVNSAEEAQRCENAIHFVRWLSDWIEYEQ